jgi:hypothetical protein
MSTTVKRPKRHVVGSQAKKVVYNVYSYLSKKNPQWFEKNYILRWPKRVDYLTYSTVYRVVKEASKPQEDYAQSTPGKKDLGKNKNSPR